MKIYFDERPTKKMTGVTVRPGWAVVPRKDAFLVNGKSKYCTVLFSKVAAAEYYRQPDSRPKSFELLALNFERLVNLSI